MTWIPTIERKTDEYDDQPTPRSRAMDSAARLLDLARLTATTAERRDPPLVLRAHARRRFHLAQAELPRMEGVSMTTAEPVEYDPDTTNTKANARGKIGWKGSFPSTPCLHEAINK